MHVNEARQVLLSSPALSERAAVAAATVVRELDAARVRIAELEAEEVHQGLSVEEWVALSEIYPRPKD